MASICVLGLLSNKVCLYMHLDDYSTTSHWKFKSGGRMEVTEVQNTRESYEDQESQKFTVNNIQKVTRFIMSI